MRLHFFKWDLRNARDSFSSQSNSVLVLFLHGLGGTGQIWRPIAASLEEDFLCIAPDQRGHGNSRPVEIAESGKFHANDYAKDLIELLTHLRQTESFKHVVIVGHSMGVRSGLATVTSLLHSGHPLTSLIRGFISVDIGFQSKWGGGIGKPLANFISQLPVSFDDRQSMKDYLFKHCPDPAIAQYLSAVSKKTALNGMEKWVFPFDHSALEQTILQADQAPIEDWVRQICEAGIPILALRGARSQVWLKKDFEEAKQNLAHDNLVFEEWENCGHGLPFEQREKFVSRVREFMRIILPTQPAH